MGLSGNKQIKVNKNLNINLLEGHGDASTYFFDYTDNENVIYFGIEKVENSFKLLNNAMVNDWDEIEGNDLDEVDLPRFLKAAKAALSYVANQESIA